ncbi:MAG: hypothetical protein EBU46_00310 [Nitrosomonadaceae bacterium]|nr:hypothetical protein [Nitrosomonadaceae bacterium]
MVAEDLSPFCSNGPQCNSLPETLSVAETTTKGQPLLQLLINNNSSTTTMHLFKSNSYARAWAWHMRMAVLPKDFKGVIEIPSCVMIEEYKALLQAERERKRK